MSSIYQDIILDHYRYPRNFGKLEQPSCSVDVNNPLCGDKLRMEITEQKGKIKEITFSGEGCAISMASASMLTEYAKGKSKDELKKMNKDFILKELLKIELTPNRIKCALLSWEALVKVINE